MAGIFTNICFQMDGKELERCGLPGATHIKTTLSKTRKVNTLVNAVKKFQNDNGLNNSVMAPALRMLDVHGVKRSDCYEQMITVASEKLISKLKTMGDQKDEQTKKKIEKHLTKCFKMYHIPQIRPIVLETLNQLDILSETYLKMIVEDPLLYADTSIKVKRQIWLKHEDLFVEAVKPVIDAYIAAKRNVLCTIDPCPTNFFSCETTKSRRQYEHVQMLMQMFGEYVPLYNKLMELIREGYLHSSDPLYCSLKLEVIMAAHESCTENGSKKNACMDDPCHDLAWSLEMSLRDKHLDHSQINRIKNIFEQAKNLTPKKVGDLAMVMADPNVVHFLCTMAIKLLRDSGHIPREHGGFILIIRLLTLGSFAHRIVQTCTVTPQMIEVIFFTKFLPSMGILIVEDQMRVELGRHDQLEMADTMGLYSNPSDTVSLFLKSDAAAALLWIHYTIDIIPRRNMETKGLLRYLRLLPILKDQLCCRCPWSHLFIHRLLTSSQVQYLLNDAEVVGIIIDRLFLSSLKLDIYLKYQLLRLINQSYRNLHASITAAIMEHISPSVIGECSDAEKYKAEYDRVVEKMSRKEEEVVPLVTPTRTLSHGSQMMQSSSHLTTPMRVQSTPSHNFDY